MIDWVTVSLALYLAGHFVCFVISRLIAGRNATYSLPRTIWAFLSSWISLPVITAVFGVSPSSFVGSRNFYLTSIMMSAIFLFIFRNQTAAEKKSSTKKALMNMIAEEGYAALTNEIPKSQNPYRLPNTEVEDLERADYWNRGYVLAEKRKK